MAASWPMSSQRPPSKLNTALLMIGFVVVLIVGLGVYSIGLDWLGKTMQGSMIEELLNLGYSAVMWIGLAFVIGALIFGRREK